MIRWIGMGLVCVLCMSSGCMGHAQPSRYAGGPGFEKRCVPPTRPVTPQTEAGQRGTAPDAPGDTTNALADALEIEPLVQQLERLRASGRTQSIDYLLVRQEITERVLLTMFEVGSTIAEITCERDRTDQVADQLDELDAGRVKKLTLASVLAGGVTSIVSGGIGLAAGSSVANNAVNVAGGALATLFGGTALFVSSKERFNHERNLLKEIWDDPPQTRVFPEFVWRFLHRKFDHHAMTLREEIVAAWRQQGRLGDANSDGEHQRAELFFGQGGDYTASDLRARASMLETLEASVRLITEQLEGFVRDVVAGHAHAPGRPSS
ncbi:MAG TPA: hypothetical protein VFA38_08845 [Nitrospirales bacterium]|nr:hypothetical protein [Nitrospirales bacterium]